MTRKFLRPFHTRTAKSITTDSEFLSPAAAAAPSSSSSVMDFFAKHSRKSPLEQSFVDPTEPATSTTTLPNPSSGGSTVTCHKTSTTSRSLVNNNNHLRLLSTLSSSSSSSSLNVNSNDCEFDFLTSNAPSTSTSSLHRTADIKNNNNKMLKRLYSRDEDDLYHHLPLKEQAKHSPPSSPQQQQTQPPLPPRWSVGKISILILACLSLTDIVFHMVDAQMESLQDPDHYDALSADVIRPAFRYHHHYHNDQQQRRSGHTRPSMGLGSAAISSVTTALSPILPFTGGIDLRREDYWTNGWWGSVSSIVEQVRDAFDGVTQQQEAVNTVLETPRGGATVTKTKKRQKAATTSSSNHKFVLSSTEPFAPLQEIAELTLQDVAEAFRFAVENTRPDFQINKFLSGLLPRAKKVVDRMSTAVATARGRGVAAPVTEDDSSSGDIDALSFCAAMRIFAEWRVLRQVPPGYKGYAVGMTLGQKDIVQNIAKIEQAIHSFVDHRLAAADDNDEEEGPVSSPTLRELLQYEVDAAIQDLARLPQLKEKSAAMGLLWVRRQLQYQTAIFVNVMEMPERFESTRAAVQGAYNEVYNKYHGWAVQKIFSYSFQAAPDATEIYKYMDLHKLAEVQKEAHDRIICEEGGHRHFSFRSSGDGLSDNPFERFGRHVGKEWDKFAGNVVQEWDKLANGIGQLFGGQPPKPVPVILTSAVSPLTTTTSVAMESPVSSPDADQVAADVKSGASKGLEVENYVNEEMEKNAHAHIRAYLQVATPLLQDLERLFDEFNMNDPTKV